jgi:HEAT repeat protein
MTKQVVAAALVSMLFAAVLFLTMFRSEPSSTYSADSTAVWLQDLEERFDALERRLSEGAGELGRFRPSAFTEESPDDLNTPQEGEESDEGEAADRRELRDQIAQLRSAVNDLGYRIRTLEEDPITRGYAFLESENGELRREGIRSLRRLARFDPEARNALRQMLDDPDPSVRREAIDAVGDLGDKEAIPSLMQLLDDGDAESRREAVQNLGKLGAKLAGPSIAELLADPSERVRREAADVLGRLGTKEATAALLGALGDKDEEVRGETIAALGEIGAPEALPHLRKIYDTDPGRHRVRLVRALQALGDNGPLQQEVKRLGDTALTSEDARARGRAVQMLSWLARKEAQEIFQKAREDPSEWVRREAERALRSDRSREGDRRGPRGR